jgi:hypothetical protein
MSDQGEANNDDDLERALPTGIRDQLLVVVGWGASHADTGTPGPHVHLATNDGRDPVLKTSQIPDLVDALHAVGRRIDRAWAEDGETWFTGDEPDDNDPAVIRQKEIDRLEFFDRLQAHFPEVAAILLRSENRLDASAAIAPLLGVDEVEVETRLDRMPLFSLTQIGRAARAARLAELRGQS